MHQYTTIQDQKKQEELKKVNMQMIVVDRFRNSRASKKRRRLRIKKPKFAPENDEYEQ